MTKNEARILVRYKRQNREICFTNDAKTVRSKMHLDQILCVNPICGNFAKFLIPLETYTAALCVDCADKAINGK